MAGERQCPAALPWKPTRAPGDGPPQVALMPPVRKGQGGPTVSHGLAPLVRRFYRAPTRCTAGGRRAAGPLRRPAQATRVDAAGADRDGRARGRELPRHGRRRRRLARRAARDDARAGRGPPHLAPAHARGWEIPVLTGHRAGGRRPCAARAPARLRDCHPEHMRVARTVRPGSAVCRQRAGVRDSARRRRPYAARTGRPARAAGEREGEAWRSRGAGRAAANEPAREKYSLRG